MLQLDAPQSAVAAAAPRAWRGLPAWPRSLRLRLVVWLLLWKGNFNIIEYGVSFLGLITVVFVVAAIKAGPQWAALGRGLAPSLARARGAQLIDA